MALELTHTREAKLASSVLREWLCFVERNIGILYLQHRLKANVQEELLQTRGAELAAQELFCRARKSRCLGAWRSVILRKAALYRRHWGRSLLARALRSWVVEPSPRWEVEVYEAQVSGENWKPLPLARGRPSH
jgi:hypothetical protein